MMLYGFHDGRGPAGNIQGIADMPSSVTVTWSPSSHANPVLYQLQYRRNGSDVWINANLAPSTATSAIVTGLVAGGLYEFRHIATNAPVWWEVSTPTVLRVGIPPAAPTNLQVS